MRIHGQFLTAQRTLVWLGGLLLLSAAALAREPDPPQPQLENEHLFMFLRLHTPEQMAAFYEARGFPQEAIQRLGETCFVMAHVENRGQQVLWLESKNWRFVTATGELQRLDRSHWDAVWDEIDLPQASRSTFGWTQLPEERDLQPGEPVGGNLILPATEQSFTLEADFHTGNHKRAGMVSVRFENLHCAKDRPDQ